MGGNSSPRVGEQKKNEEITLKTIKDAIPPSCFERSLLISTAYVIRDCIYAATLFYLALKIDLIPSQALRVLAWIVYGFFQGCVGTGIWILAHECGHGAFSPFPLWNDFMGWVMHSALLVPYFSWKITHARHHRYTNNKQRDTAFVPRTEKEAADSPNYLPAWLEMLEDTPIYSCLSLLAHQLGGWQLYLLCYVTSGPKSRPIQAKNTSRFQTQSHFDPTSSLFTPSQRILIVISDIGLLLTGAAIYYLGQQVGLLKTFLLYFVPYFWVHHWLVAITYLHHTHPTVPHFDDETWTFTKGALSTVDRDFGFIGRHFFHHIIEHHVVHHLFPRIPFYRAEEATDAIIPVLGDQYHHDGTNFLQSLVQTYFSCAYVVDNNKDGIFHWALPAKVAAAAE
ncbi:hypothetical protein ARAM_002056 [Aspergillus rambellii]|uniref:Fatty acid desaturase domain-containing protein n=1 Tax=Aspergillus rambellii TaxID=308745 RepID=A0A0F8XPM6_9EURO|nr:hypothetical protein ARAM_002056 [Aspergillus rambellii]